ncbi:branched chain amino acid ABC transporter periplasmic ligand-binding protein [Burkholderia pseudomallei]|nr:branched chain amino acid ABC transporter periplasmic ligand-binding protein [Burkholderia pseudomallei]CAJ8052201.1 branched chain amino acid ABC transporter periplasmic ligand-binding protein [Burkholderia pseudomallei]
MTNRMLGWGLPCLIACAGWLSDAHADTVVRIGHVAPLTGAIAHLGKDNEDGARLAIDEINAQGLHISGQKIRLELDPQDDAADPRMSVQVAQRLVDDHVVAVIGHMTSGTSIPASKIYSDAGILQISPSATNPTYTQQGFRTTYRMVATDAQQGPALAAYARQHMKASTVAIVDDSTAYGQGLASEFEKAARAQGMTVLSRDATNDKAIDFRAILTKVKSENPDIIMYGGMDSTGGPFTKQARELGLRSRVLGGDGLCSEALSQLAGAAADNVVCSQAGTALESMPQGKQFEAKFEKQFGKPIELYAPFTYDAVYIVVSAMKRADSIDPAKVLAAMPATDYEGVVGRTSFDSKGDLKHGVISIYGFQGGKRSLIEAEKM